MKRENPSEEDDFEDFFERFLVDCTDTKMEFSDK